MALHHVFYTFQGSPRFLPIDAVTSEEALAAAARLHPQIKTLSHAEPVPDKVPTWLQVEELHWDESVVAFLAHLATHSTVFSDAPEWATRACERPPPGARQCLDRVRMLGPWLQAFSCDRRGDRPAADRGLELDRPAAVQPRARAARGLAFGRRLIAGNERRPAASIASSATQPAAPRTVAHWRAPAGPGAMPIANRRPEKKLSGEIQQP